MNRLILRVITILIVATLYACKSVPQRKTVASLDSSKEPTIFKKNTPNKSKRTKDEIREAYWRYLNNASTSDSSRQQALNRLAELEFEVSDSKTNSKNDVDGENEEAANFTSKQLEKSISLYQLSLRDYPNAKGNDKLLYQLAKAQDQIGKVDDSFESLLNLTINHPKSIHYVESQFRIGEYQFIRSDYAEAERAYTEVIVSPKNDIFLEKALFKRGWARFKQSYYEEAIEDFEAAISVHGFTEPEKFDTAEKEQFDEYFRAMGLSFASLGGAVPLKQYFSNNPDSDFKFHTYAVISDIYLDQERYSDAVKIMDAFKTDHPKSPKLAIAQNRIVNIWRESGYKEKLFPAIEKFYISYNRHSSFWKNQSVSSKTKISVDDSLRINLLLTAQYHHSQNQKSGTALSFNRANKWYSRYLSDYSENAITDKVHRQYAELLLSNGRKKEALNQYEKAAFDEAIILDKTAAYQSIVLSHQLYKGVKDKSSQNGKRYLEKQIDYTLLYARIYSEDKDLNLIISNAAKSAYEKRLFEHVIELANFSKIATNSSLNQTNTHLDIALLKAQSHFNLKEFDAAESAYRFLLENLKKKDKRRNQLVDRLALSIYQQGARFKAGNNQEEAIYHFMKVAETLPKSEIASTGLYDAIALMIENKSWQRSVSAIKKFQKLYPRHKLSAEVTKKLSVAYLELNQDDKAAQQFERISAIEKDRTTQMAALWQAAELYQKQNNLSAATRALSKFANTYKKPFSQNMEALRALVEIYEIKGNKRLKHIWRNRIIKADKNASASEKTDRTLYITARTILEIAKEEKLTFDSQQLRAPFKKNLKRKKDSLQKAIKLFGQASSYGIAEITTESTYSIATLYADFSKSLLNSERPKHLNSEELEQYNILLEDQAFPFEDKAIEFHEINLARIKGGTFDQWVTLSLAKLKLLFPTKYARKSKIEGVIRTIK